MSRLTGAARLLSILVFLVHAPPALGVPAEVTGLRFDTQTEFHWDPLAGASGYHVYRGTVAGLPVDAGVCFLGSVQGTDAEDHDVPTPGTVQTYLLSAFDGSGEGTLGTLGPPRTPATSCVPARRFLDQIPDGDPGDGVSDGVEPLRNPSQIHSVSRRETSGVYLHTGEFFLQAGDLEVVGRGPNWLLQRNYRSQVPYDGPLGHGWDFNLNARLAPLGVDVYLHDGTGRRERFNRVSPTRFDSPAGRYDVLIENPDGSFTLRTPQGTLFDFHAFDGSNVQGALERIEDRIGNAQTLQYDHQGLLVSSVDTLGRNYAFAYDANGRLTSLSDFAGRAWIYAYDGAGDLVSARSPVVPGTFPSGKTTSYTYSSGFGDPRLNHDLLTVVFPNEHPGGPAGLQMVYTTAGAAFDLGRLESWTIGGTNASAVAAGGTYAFSYTSLNGGGNPADLALPRRRTDVTDRAGNERRYVHNFPGNCIETTEFTNRNVRIGEPDYTTSTTYNADGETTEIEWPEGNRTQFLYDSPGLDRYREGNTLEVRHIADTVASGGRGDGHGGEADDRVTTYAYDPVYNLLRTRTDPRGNDGTYVPQNGGPQSAARYTTEWTFDYQEGDPATNGINALATRFDIDLTGLVTSLGDLNGDADTSQAVGNAIVRVDPAVTLDALSNQASIEGDVSQDIVSTFEYDGFGQLAAAVDAEGNRQVYVYHPENDPDGDGSPTAAPADARALDPTNGGYVATHRLDVASDPDRNNKTDPSPADVRSDFLYDDAGNPTHMIDGRGILERRLYNELDQVVELRRAAATADAAGPDGDPATGRGETGLTAHGFKIRYEYDANDNVVAKRVEDRDTDRAVGPFVDQTWTYDILDNPVEADHEVTSGGTVVVAYRYDANENRIRETAPEGNTFTSIYDERDLVFELTRGASGPRGGTPSARTHDYDGNENVVTMTDGNGNPVDTEYDGFDRRVREIDQVGNTREWFYDPVDNVVRFLGRGPIGGTTPPDRSGATNVDLVDTGFLYDELNRLFRRDEVLFVPSGAAPGRTPILAEGPLGPGDGAINTVYEYDSLSRRTFEVEDSGATARTDYDGISRILVATEPDGSPSVFTYDDNHNLIEIEEIELADPPGPPDESFLTTYLYDSLDRRVMSVDNAGQTFRQDYDSLDTLRARSGPKGPPGGTINRRSPGNTGIVVPINDDGNVTRYVYDGLGRRTSVARILTASGAGDGTLSPAPDVSNPANPDGLVTTIYVWDGNSLLSDLIDDKGNTTTYVYDNLDRRVLVTRDDGTTSSLAHDAEDNVTQTTDPNGSVATHLYDDAWRRTSTTVAPGAGVVGTTLQLFEFDGLDRMTRGLDNNTGAPDDDVTITFLYDSLGRVIEETQSISNGSATGLIDSGWSARDLKTDLIYPGGRHIEYTYDAADRLVHLEDTGGTGSSDYEYFGMDRVHTRRYMNGIRTTRMSDDGTTDIGFDEIRRTVLLRHIVGPPTSTVLAGFDYSYDRASNRTSVLRLHDPAGPDLVGELYGHDSAYRVVGFHEGPLDVTRTPTGPPEDTQVWTFDGVDNWVETDRNGVLYLSTPNNLNEYDEAQGGGTRVDDGLPDDFLDPAITLPPDGLNMTHDKNGNLVDNGVYSVGFDFRNRQVTASRNAGGLQVAVYVYDALDRRVQREVTNSGPMDEERRYFYDDCTGSGRSACTIEQRDQTDTVVLETSFSPKIGDPVCYWVGGGANPLYFLEDDQNSIIAITDDTNPPNVLERYVYDVNGKPIIEDPFNNPIPDGGGNFLPFSQQQNPYLFLGQLYDPELSQRTNNQNDDLGGYYYFDFGRYLNPNTGRFIDRIDETINAYSFALNNPVSLGDSGSGTLWIGNAALDPLNIFFGDTCECCDAGCDEEPDPAATPTTEKALNDAGTVTTNAGRAALITEIAQERKGKKAFEGAKTITDKHLKSKNLSASQAGKMNKAGNLKPSAGTKNALRNANKAQSNANKASKAGKGLTVLNAGIEVAKVKCKLDQTVRTLDDDLKRVEKTEDHNIKQALESYKKGQIDRKTLDKRLKEIREVAKEGADAKAQAARANAISDTVEGGLRALESWCPVPIVDPLKCLFGWR